LIFIQGRDLDRGRVRGFSGKKILWNAEFWPYKGQEDNLGAKARLNIVEPLEDFDLILTGCPLSAEWLRETRGLQAEWFPMMGVDPDRHRKIEIGKEFNVGFYGAPSPRRIGIWKALCKELEERGSKIKPLWFQGWGEQLVHIINRCKIVLNIHFEDMLNTESRIYEVLGCGGFCLSEPISCPELFVDAIHLEIGKASRMAERIIELLSRHDDYLERIGNSGKEYIHTRFNIVNVLNSLIKKCKGILIPSENQVDVKPQIESHTNIHCERLRGGEKCTCIY
tara:strand:- start:1420 stop:2262 length:843 start_codon:yes stop_codon:yes gene_type:complete